MQFNEKDYKGNVMYCEYVFNNNEVLFLGLNTPAEIQYVANKYVEKINEIRGFESEELYEDEDILIEVTEKAIKKFESLKKGFTRREPIEKVNSKNDLSRLEGTYELRQNMIDDSIDFKLEQEKVRSRKGGYSYNDSYDDLGYDEEYGASGLRRK